MINDKTKQLYKYKRLEIPNIDFQKENEVSKYIFTYYDFLR